jgi:hypothetical protein
VITIMQTDAARRTYRWVTFGIAFVVSLSVLVPALALLRFIPLGAAIWLDIHRYHLSRTPAGGAEDLGFGTPNPISGRRTGSYRGNRPGLRRAGLLGDHLVERLVR